MKDGIFIQNRVRLIIKDRERCFRDIGSHSRIRRRLTVSGCIVSSDISTLNVVLVKEGLIPIHGLTIPSAAILLKSTCRIKRYSELRKKEYF